MNERVSVAAFGSCRVISPVFVAHRRDKLTFRNVDQRWYTHTTPETLQKINVLTGQFEVPANVAPLLIDIDSIGAKDANEVLKGAYGPDYFNDVDIGIVEISTRRIFDLDGVFLHATSVQKYRGIETAEAEKGLLEQTKEYWMEFDRLEVEAKAIAAKFPKTIFYLLIERSADLVTPQTGRKALNDFFRKFADNKTIFVFDPNEGIDAFGVQKALTDNNHFTDAYSNQLSVKLAERVQAIFAIKPEPFAGA